MLGAGGVVLRYGYFYGAGSAISREGSMAADISRRRLPVVGSGAGVWSFVHVDGRGLGDRRRARRSRARRCCNVVDDEPAPVAQWLPALGEALGAPPPRRVPALLARLLAGSYGAAVMTSAQGASNAAARASSTGARATASWREGFRTAL